MIKTSVNSTKKTCYFEPTSITMIDPPREILLPLGISSSNISNLKNNNRWSVIRAVKTALRGGERRTYYL